VRKSEDNPKLVTSTVFYLFSSYSFVNGKCKQQYLDEDIHTLKEEN
jgi:hypothetical protein